MSLLLFAFFLSVGIEGQRSSTYSSVVDQIGTAGATGNTKLLEDLSKGDIGQYVAPPSFQITARNARDLVKLVKGCSVTEKYSEKSEVAEGRQEGSVYWGCSNRPVSGQRCKNEGYGLIVYRGRSAHKLVYFRHDASAVDRCPGVPAPPPILSKSSS